MFEIAAVLINYNSSSLTQECIESILKNTDPSLNFQIIVVDNCSEKEDFLQLQKYCDQTKFEHLQLVRSKINTGFGAGNMLGVHYACAKHLAFINNDTVFLNDCLSILIKALQNNPTIGMVGGQSFKEDGTPMQAFDHFASVTKAFFGRDFIEKCNPKKYPKRKATYLNPLAVSYVQGSFMVIRNQDFNAVGGFDTNIFLYYEETDISKRLLKINKSCFLIPDAKYIHHHGASTPSGMDIKIELKISLLYVIKKHSGYWAYKFLVTYLQIQYFFKSFFKPKYWQLFSVLLIGAPLSHSLKTRQKLIE
ncbi:glycosyltransferase family 2 protein [Flavobacterium crassostreae]|uniref:Glycosyl transferase family 2 n=1 Tax=Flavobacterium crassostreae TaxID=1763534 RepID=A0A1B9E9R8_9FLAO|nr:glycosyltransferase family 2 protein [Flavobacterium crassostreae]OCB78710.1 glycosyl transferase family 2 [Flavobacterium crassostreae]